MNSFTASGDFSAHEQVNMHFNDIRHTDNFQKAKIM